MKRALFDTVTVLPFASGNVVDRTGYESAVLAVTVEASQTATIKVETADSTAGPYEPVKDSRISAKKFGCTSGKGMQREVLEAPSDPANRVEAVWDG